MKNPNMKAPKIDFENVFEVLHKETSIKNHSGHVRIVKYLDNKKHGKPQIYEVDLLKLIK